MDRIRRHFGMSIADRARSIPDRDQDMSHQPSSSRSPDPDADSVDNEFHYVSPHDWRAPAMVVPVEEPLTNIETANLGAVSTDAKLYSMKERASDGSIKVHSVLRMPSSLPGGNTASMNTFNLLMADVSGSMYQFWPHVQSGWNDLVAPVLVGETKIFTFDSTVVFRRSDTHLVDSDFSRGGTELTGALQTIVSEVYQCKQKYVNVFFITDGAHNGCNIRPDSIINIMEAPGGKVCNVFVLGAGGYFPVQYSIDIRSRLHNGSSNLPSLFWGKESEDIRTQMADIGSKLSGGASLSMTIDAVGTSLPGLQTKSIFHLQEWVYFPHEPEKYQSLTTFFNNKTATLMLQPQVADMEILFEIFRQWNSVIIQLKSKKEAIPGDILNFMERLFDTCMVTPKPSGPLSLSARLEAKSSKKEEMEFRSLLHGIKNILTTEKFKDEIELAENILSTTVTRSKYEVRALQVKGHTDKEFEKDCEEFMKVYNDHKQNILTLTVNPEDRCQATSQSTLSDLQDEAFPELMNKNKFDFLKAFTISGIPVFAPTRDSVTLNPWSFSVQRILNAPYTIMSQAAMETMAQNSSDSVNKEVQTKKDDNSTNFNAVVPVFPASAAKAMQPLVRTRLYAMCVTFATLKNPHLIDFNVHMAALGVTWVRCLFEHPTTPRPEHVRIRIESLEATAALYIDRPGYANYAKVLKENTNEALMTESDIVVDGKTIKCETLIKPMFFLNLMQRGEQKLDSSVSANIVRGILLEYIGRCLSQYKSIEGEDTPYTDFFAATLDDQEKKKKWIQKFIDDAKSEMANRDSGLLASFYSLESARKAAQAIAKEEIEKQKNKLTAAIPLKVNMTKVSQLRKVTTAGDVSWTTLQTFAKEIGLGDDVINDLFSEESVFVYTFHALKYRSSKERLSKSVSDYSACKELVTKLMQEENLRLVSKDLYNALVSSLENVWLKEYMTVHSEVVEPMTRQQIVHLAQQRGIEVTEATFDTVYKKYRPKVGLLGNACQTKACPYFLQPHKSYNQHASVERLMGDTPFMHALHQTAYDCRDKDVSATVTEIVSGNHTKDKKQIPVDAVSKWTSDIKKLKNIYKEKAESESQGTE